MDNSQNNGNYLNNKTLVTLNTDKGYYRAQLSRSITGSPKYISLGLRAIEENFREATVRCYRLEQVIVEDLRKEIFDYSLEKYRSEKILKKDVFRVGECIDKLEDEYFKFIGKVPRSLRTFDGYKRCLKRYAKNYLNDYVNKPTLENIIKASPAGSSIRNTLIGALKHLCEKFDINTGIDFSKWTTKRIQPTKIKTHIPDDEIIDGFILVSYSKRKKGANKFSGDFWGWVYGVLATYGIRVHETLAIDIPNSFIPPHYEIYIFPDLSDGTKTNKGRFVLPLHKEWVQHFNLLKIKNDKFFEKYLEYRLEKYRTHRVRGFFTQDLNSTFQDRKVPFSPGILRHCYNCRGYLLGFHAGIMSDLLGHSVEVNEKYYQNWKGKETLIALYTKLIEINDRLKGKPEEIVLDVYDDLKDDYKELLLSYTELDNSYLALQHQLYLVQEKLMLLENTSRQHN